LQTVAKISEIVQNRDDLNGKSFVGLYDLIEQSMKMIY